MPLPDYKVLTFACHGTLVDRDAGVLAALRPLVASAGITIGRHEALEAFHRQDAAERSRGPVQRHAERLAAVHRALAQDWGVICSDDDRALFAASVRHWPTYADAAGALQYLRRYFRLAVLTNADRECVETAARRLDVRFDVVVAAAETGEFKPSRRAFEHLIERLARLGLAPGQALHVGCDVAHDVLPAAQAGLPSAWLDRGSESRGTGAIPAGCVHVFRSLADLVRLHQEQLRA
jgi:2-haloacid dehalogenase